MTESDAAPDPVESIAASLARLRGRRGPRPPWAEGDGPWAGRGGPHARGHEHPHERGDRRTTPPWGPGAGGRFAGPARLRLLEALSAASHPLSVSEVADAVGVDQPRASRLVQQSVELGLVRREADPDDARRTRVALTDEGARIVRGFRGERRDAVGTALASFTDAERSDLARLLAKLAESWPR